MLRLTALFISMAIFATAGCAGQLNAGPPGVSSSSSAIAPGSPNRASFSYLPGESAHGLPGALFPCLPPIGNGQTQCTMAINLNIPPNPLANLPASLIPGLQPKDLAVAYNLPTQNAGGTVAVVDAYDDPLAEADLAVYRLAFGLPLCLGLTGCFRKVNQHGQAGSYPALNVGWSQEIALDLDMVSTVCPRCKIVLVEANSSRIQDLGASVDQAARMGAVAIANSYYAPEWAAETAQEIHYNHPGIAITASSGDHHSPSYPAASQYVTAVGGTTLSSGTGETPWQFGGQGCSAYIFTRPQGQPALCSSRVAVDMAAVADPNTGVAVFSTFSGGWIVAGGTSVGAALIAGAYGLAGRGHGPSYSYARPHAFHDVPPAGFDVQTGLGSPAGLSGL